MYVQEKIDQKMAVKDKYLSYRYFIKANILSKTISLLIYKKNQFGFSLMDSELSAPSLLFANSFLSDV
jgi:hypothetical protein